LSVWVALPPLPSLTVTFAAYVPAVVYVLVGFCCADVVVSPKSHAYESVSPSASVAAAAKLIAVPAVTSPLGVRVMEPITGLAFGALVQPGIAGAVGPSTCHQSNTASTVVVAALESAKKPIFAFAGSAVEAWPACVQVVPSAEDWPSRLG